MIPFYAQPGAGGASALPLSNYVNSKALANGVNEDETVPAGAYFAVFGANGDFYVKRGGTAALPTDVTNGSGSAANPYIIAVEPGDVIGIMAGATVLVTISYYGKG